LISGEIALAERRDGDSGVEIRLGDLEERVEIAAFLATLASINLVVWSAVLPIAGAIARTDPAQQPCRSGSPAGWRDRSAGRSSDLPAVSLQPTTMRCNHHSDFINHTDG